MITEKTALEIVSGSRRLESISHCLEITGKLASAELVLSFYMNDPDKREEATFQVPAAIAITLLDGMKEREEIMLEKLNALAMQEAQNQEAHSH